MLNKSKNRSKGSAGEEIAVDYLKKLGFKILERNWHYSRNSEIDIIAKDKDTIVFAEVKTRSNENCGHPLEAINQTKLKRIYSAALAYLQQTEESYKRYRIDVISVIGFENPKIEHLKDVSMN